MFRKLSRVWVNFMSSKKQHFFALRGELLQKHKQYKPWKNVRLLHSITMSRYDPQLIQSQNNLKHQDYSQIEQVITSLSRQLHLLPHRQFNMLLQVLKQQGIFYNRQMDVFRACNKILKALIGNQYKGEHISRTLQLAKDLRFPKLVTNKMLQNYLSIQPEQMNKKTQLRTPLNHQMNILILCLQDPAIPLPFTRKSLEKIVSGNANTLETLTLLYHISCILAPALNKKIDYQYTMSEAREILFDPHQDTSKQGEQAKKEMNEQKRKRLKDQSTQIFKLFNDKVDVTRLKAQIVKSIQGDVQPLTKQAILYTADIAQLKPYVQNFFSQKFQQLTPVQVMRLAKYCPTQTATQLIEKYRLKMKGIMNVQENAYLLIQANRIFLMPVVTQQILQLIQSLKNISYDEFLAISRLAQLLGSKHQKQIGNILELVKSKLSSQEEGNN